MDISMCDNQTCTLRDTCIRFTAKPNPYNQAYGAFQPTNGVCEYYWPIKPKEQPDE